MDIPKDLFEDVLSDITPRKGDREREGKLVQGLFQVLEGVIGDTNPKIKPLMVGSIAKGTDLRDDKDFDIFLQFPKSTGRPELQAQGLAIGKRVFSELGSKPEISYAEHPYVKGRYRGFMVEIVPCYKIAKGGRVLSAVDRSPLHTEFVIEHLNRKPGLRDDIRLLKRFMKANGIYGAHAAVEGFSGYLCELLVIKYGSFIDVLKAAKTWKKHEYVALDKNPGALKFPDAPLISIDPVDPRRNVAAAVSVEKLAKFIYLSEAFLDHPNKQFFRHKIPLPMGKKEFYVKLHKRGTQLVAIRFKPPELIEDTLLPQLTKSLKAISSECERAGFRVLKKGQWTDGREVVFLLEFSVWELPRVMKKTGPFFDSKVADMRGFIDSNRSKAMSKPYLEGDHWAIDVEREYRHADTLLRDYLKNPEGFGKNLRSVDRFSLKINSEINDIKNPEFWRFMSSFW